MNKKILLLEHHDNPWDDLATIYLRQLGFDLEPCHPFKGDSLPANIRDYHGAVIYGGEANVTELDKYPYLKDEIKWIRQAIEADLTMLGICLGAQLIAHCLGARVQWHELGLCEFGYYKITPTAAGQSCFPGPMYVTQAHFQQFDLPEGATLLARGELFPNQAFSYGRHIFGVQFHPEVSAQNFRRWQDSDWAFYGHPGAQSRSEQDAILPHADPIQGAWFHRFLDGIFVSPMKEQAAVA